jgi:hypothetical protein
MPPVSSPVFVKVVKTYAPPVIVPLLLRECSWRSGKELYLVVVGTDTSRRPLFARALATILEP